MKTAIALMVGALLGAAASLPIRRRLIRYSMAPLPEPWHGPKMRIWEGGVETTFDPMTQGWGAATA
ncbi:hypothetical protein [Microbacterium paludicola]|uniref:hypothetical protein n=1 Tax=Microbacterium paludicola TaxID=300019 RepID=UPI00119D3BF7|nr:hypothetical protein [Microbacterium paludicola]